MRPVVTKMPVCVWGGVAGLRVDMMGENVDRSAGGRVGRGRVCEAVGSACIALVRVAGRSVYRMVVDG